MQQENHPLGKISDIATGLEKMRDVIRVIKMLLLALISLSLRSLSSSNSDLNISNILTI